MAWYSTRSSIVSGLHDHTNTARRPQRAMQTGLSKRLIYTTENVTAVRRTLQRLQICSRDTIVSYLSSNPRTRASWLIFLILCLWRRYAATAAVTAATQLSILVSNLHKLCFWRHIWTLTSVRPGDAFVSLLAISLITFFRIMAVSNGPNLSSKLKKNGAKKLEA